MSNGASRCNCPRCYIRSLLWPAVVITLGVLFLLHEMRGGSYDFWSYTYPFVLIVAGAVLLVSSLVPATGHIDSTQTPSSVPSRIVTTPGTTPGSIPGSGNRQGQ